MENKKNFGFGTQIRKSPYFDATVKWGATGFSVYKRNVLKNGKKVKINKSTLGIELEVYFLIKKSFFLSKGLINMKNISKYISHIASCIEIVGYRQIKKGIISF